MRTFLGESAAWEASDNRLSGTTGTLLEDVDAIEVFDVDAEDEEDEEDEDDEVLLFEAG